MPNLNYSALCVSTLCFDFIRLSTLIVYIYLFCAIDKLKFFSKPRMKHNNRRELSSIFLSLSLSFIRLPLLRLAPCFFFLVFFSFLPSLGADSYFFSTSSWYGQILSSLFLLYGHEASVLSIVFVLFTKKYSLGKIYPKLVNYGNFLFAVDTNTVKLHTLTHI